MRVVIQRVKRANVKIEDKIVGEIGQGLLVLFAIHKDDPEAGSIECEKAVKKLADKIINLRIFSDKQDKMNLSVQDVKGEIMVVSQFTLYGNTKKGNRPSFIDSAKPDKAIPIYKKFVLYIREQGIKVATGEFGAMMGLEMVNDGPVTIIMEG
jgi:D-tyrosyl-tRNA(Tyr) deacylase